MGTYTILLQDTKDGRVAVSASAKPDQGGGETPASELFKDLLWTLSENAEGRFEPEILSHH